MVAKIHPLDAEEFSYKILVQLEGQPEYWESDAVSDTRRQQAAAQLEGWFRRHGASPDTAEAYDAFDSLVPKVAALYEPDGRASRDISFLGRAALIGDTIQHLLAAPGPTALDTALKAPANADRKTDPKTGLLGRIGESTKTLLRKEGEWYSGKTSGLLRAVKQGTEAGEKIAQKTAETVKRVWEDNRHLYEENSKNLRSAAMTTTLVAMSMGALHTQRASRIQELAAKAELGYDDVAMTRWAVQYGNHFQAQLEQSLKAYPDLGFSASVVKQDGHHIVGFGSEIDSDAARRLLDELRIDRRQLLKGKIRLTEQEAALLLHADSERIANRTTRLSHIDKMIVIEGIHAGDELLIAQIDGLPEQGVSKAKDTISFHEAQNRHRVPKASEHSAKADKLLPNTQPSAHKAGSALSEKSAHAHSRKQTHGETWATHHTPPAPTHTRPMPQAAKGNFAQAKHRLRTNASTGLRNNKNDYIDRATADDIRAKLQALPPRRIGDPTDPFYDVFAEMMIKLEKCKLTMYKDSEGHPTIGIGHLLKRADTGATTRKVTDAVLGKGMFDYCMAGKPITETQAMALVKYHALKNEKALCGKKRVGLEAMRAMTPEQFAGILSVAFNGGPGLVHKGICEPLRKQDYGAAADQICKHLNRQDLNGLHTRRAFESELVGGEAQFYKPDVAAERVTQEIKSIKSSAVVRFAVPDEDYLKKLLRRIEVKQPTLVQSQENPDSLISVDPRTEELKRISWSEAVTRYGDQIAEKGTERSRP